jgi:3-hydroxyisobutyrate dehydrogenase-like beta-hydroxyacid dehydrogenase
VGDDNIPLGMIGLGQMGARMARRLVEAGFELAAYDAAGTAERAPAGALPCASAAEVAARAELVHLSLPDGPAVVAVASEIASAPERTVRCVADHSTIGPEAARAAHETLAQAGVTYLDAPVSGGTRGADQGTLAVMVGGERAWFERAEPALAVIARNRFLVGSEPGQGQAMKLLNNMLSGVATVATSEAVLFGEAHGLDPKVMIDVLNVSTGQNTATSDKFPTRILTGRYDAGFTIDLIAKDLDLYREEAARSGAGDAVGRVVGETMRAMTRAMPGADFTRIYLYLKGLARNEGGG